MLNELPEDDLDSKTLETVYEYRRANLIDNELHDQCWRLAGREARKARRKKALKRVTKTFTLFVFSPLK